MTIAGIQPLSLLDYPEKPCSIVFTQGCVFRCAYCHNPELIPLQAAGEHTKTIEETLRFLNERKSIVDAVCITGGEPTLQKDLEEFIVMLKGSGFHVKLDTNGIRPDIVSRLIEKKLVDYIAMDVKHRWEAYPGVIRIASESMVERCRETFSLIQSSNIAHEFRTTVAPGVHCEEDFFAIARMLRPGERYYIQNTSFVKNLDPALPREIGFDVSMLVHNLQEAFPTLFIYGR
jgi:pyruvate formate lyase activating enzyme